MSWGELKVVPLPPRGPGSSSGRGRTLNAGITHAKASILAFLHADTLVPQGWDRSIEKALTATSGNDEFPQACTFTMGIDMDSSTATASALKGAQWQGMLQCHCGLPYGDSVLSFRRDVLEYLGGYPEQPLMEDSEFMDWLRVRSLLLLDEDYKPIEHLALIKDQAKCSARRWQKYGVAYTSLVNAICIYRYRHQVLAEDLFNFYYNAGSSSGSDSPKMKSP